MPLMHRLQNPSGLDMLLLHPREPQEFVGEEGELMAPPPSNQRWRPSHRLNKVVSSVELASIEKRIFFCFEQTFTRFTFTWKIPLIRHCDLRSGGQSSLDFVS